MIFGSIAASQLNANNYVEVASFAILYYDYFLTIGVEIERFWKRTPWSLAAILFYLNRYVVLLGYIPIMVFFIAPQILQRTNSCHAFEIFIQYHLAATHVVISSILVVRTSAIYKDTRWVRLTLVITVILMTINGCIEWYFINKGHTDELIFPDGSRVGCVNLYSKAQGIELACIWGGLFVLDLMVVVLTIRKTVVLVRDCPGSVNLWANLMRDGAMYFGILSVTNLANILMLVLASPILKSMLPPFINVIASSMMARLMLNLRDTRLQRPGGDTSIAVSMPLQFVPRARGNMVSTATSSTDSSMC